MATMCLFYAVASVALPLLSRLGLVELGKAVGKNGSGGEMLAQSSRAESRETRLLALAARPVLTVDRKCNRSSSRGDGGELICRGKGVLGSDELVVEIANRKELIWV